MTQNLHGGEHTLIEFGLRTDGQDWRSLYNGLSFSLSWRKQLGPDFGHGSYCRLFTSMKCSDIVLTFSVIV